MSEGLTAETSREFLKAVIDPEIYQNIVDLGLVYGIDVHDDSVVDVTMTLTTPHCPMGPQIIADVENTLLEKGASAVNVNIVWEPAWTPHAMTDDLKRQLGIVEEPEEELALLYEPPPLPPPAKKKGLISRILGF
ncbi:MAG: metal-sulfur cluster assembly factor [Chloroflexi bacterium]|nr:metal-sulfur cluster assembly factor [Chloroflexota bacterium]